MPKEQQGVIERSVVGAHADSSPTILLRSRSAPRRTPPDVSGSLQLDKIDADRIESIEVIKGGAISGLAPAVSGVIVIRMKW